MVADHHEPEAVAQIVREVLDQVYNDPRVVAEKLGPFATTIDLPGSDGIALFDLPSGGRPVYQRGHPAAHL
jgi:hypothetical protein